VKSKKAEITNY